MTFPARRESKWSPVDGIPSFLEPDLSMKFPSVSSIGKYMTKSFVGATGQAVSVGVGVAVGVGEGVGVAVGVGEAVGVAVGVGDGVGVPDGLQK